jgi:hypothetical protein
MKKGTGSAARALLEDERDEVERGTEADAWQRAQAWGTWEKMKAGDRSEVSKADIDAEFDAAIEQLGSRSA